MDDVIRDMARRCYGYGRWDAPYWFIGPEQGQGREEKNDLTLRAEAWLHLGGGELCDCRDFHAYIGQKEWHQERPHLQATWRALMLLLMSFLERPIDNENLRMYQRDRWGRVSVGETCVIELSGLAANSFKVARDRECFREERKEIICQRMLTYRPSLVVMYGLGERKHWEAIAGATFPSEGILPLGSTVLVFTPHPTKHGLGKAYWQELGERLRHAGSNV